MIPGKAFIAAAAWVLALSVVLVTGLPALAGKPVPGADTRAPSSSISDPARGAVIPQALGTYSIKGKASDGKNGSGVAAVEVQVSPGTGIWERATDTSGDGTWKTWKYIWDVGSLLTTGGYEIKVRATDAAGNVEGVRKGMRVTVTLD